MLGFAFLIFVLAVIFHFNKGRNDDLFILGYKPFFVATGSMEPNFKTNSLAIVHKTSVENIKVGDVIAFKSKAMNGATVMHRVNRIVAPKAFITKGDNNKNEDLEVTTNKNFVGTVIWHNNEVSEYIKSLRQKNGVIIYLAIPIIILVLVLFILGRIFS